METPSIIENTGIPSIIKVVFKQPLRQMGGHITLTIAPTKPTGVAIKMEVNSPFPVTDPALLHSSRTKTPHVAGTSDLMDAMQTIVGHIASACPHEAICVILIRPGYLADAPPDTNVITACIPCQDHWHTWHFDPVINDWIEPFETVIMNHDQDDLAQILYDNLIHLWEAHA